MTRPVENVWLATWSQSSATQVHAQASTTSNGGDNFGLRTSLLHNLPIVGEGYD